MMFAFPFESATIQSASTLPGMLNGCVATPTTPAGYPGSGDPGSWVLAVSTGIPACWADAIAGASSWGWKPSIMITPALAWMASSTPRVASATELLASKPTPVAPTVAAPSLTPWSMYCSKGMLRLRETYQIDFPRALLASNFSPTGCQLVCACSACFTSRCASETLALLVVVLVEGEPAP